MQGWDGLDLLYGQRPGDDRPARRRVQARPWYFTEFDKRETVEQRWFATVWGIGVCFLWPTMLANVSERYPKGGELFIGLMGVAGALSIQYVLPALGSITDAVKRELAGSPEALAALPAAAQAPILQAANERAFHTLAGFVAILIGVFGAIALFERSRGRRTVR